MGTLFHQIDRNEFKVSKNSVEKLLTDALHIATKHQVSVNTVIEVYNVLEIRRKNNLYLWNGDNFDEQMAGFGKILQTISTLDSG